MNPEQIKAEMTAWPIAAHVGTRPRAGLIKIGIYRRINREAAGDRGIGTDRSLQIRQEIERTFKVFGMKALYYPPRAKFIEQRESVTTPKIVVVIN